MGLIVAGLIGYKETQEKAIVMPASAIKVTNVDALKTFSSIKCWVDK